MKSLSDVDVVILAGGEGTRLRRVLPDRPKAMAMVCGRPFLGHLLHQVREAGARRVVLSLGHLYEEIENYVAINPFPGLQIECVIEMERVGTGGALALAAPILRSHEVLVMNGDTYARLDLGALVEFHRTHHARVALAATIVADSSCYACLEVAESGRVTRFTERPSLHLSGLVSAGVCVTEIDVLRAIPVGRQVSFEWEVLPSLDGLFAMVGDFEFIDIGTPERLAQADSFLSVRRP